MNDVSKRSCKLESIIVNYCICVFLKIFLILGVVHILRNQLRGAGGFQMITCKPDNGGGGGG